MLRIQSILYNERLWTSVHPLHDPVFVQEERDESEVEEETLSVFVKQEQAHQEEIVVALLVEQAQELVHDPI